VHLRSRFDRRRSVWVLVSALVVAATGCGRDGTGPGVPVTPSAASQGLRIVNAYTQPVDVLVDGALVVSSAPPGQVDSVLQGAGVHTVALRASGATASVTISLSTVAGALRTIAAVRAGGILSASELDDTNSVVPAGATKVRVLHLAPNAGEIQVFRTQPDWATPIEWQFPFLYDSAALSSLGNPYYQSTLGTWDIRAWRKPSEVALGWDATTARVTLMLASGEKRTVLVLDKPGGGIQLSVIE
jgi:hypothetical protein